jgi:hypothetical protein
MISLGYAGASIIKCGHESSGKNIASTPAHRSLVSAILFLHAGLQFDFYNFAYLKCQVHYPLSRDTQRVALLSAVLSRSLMWPWQSSPSRPLTSYHPPQYYSNANHVPQWCYCLPGGVAHAPHPHPYHVGQVMYTPHGQAQHPQKTSSLNTIGSIPSSAPAVNAVTNQNQMQSAPTVTARKVKAAATPDAKALAGPMSGSQSDSETDPRTASNLERWTLAALTRMYPDKKFVKVRPPWLRNPRTGRACELDFYNQEMKLGLEVQGLQHYVYPNSWHKSRTEWEDQIYRDQLKEALCKQAGVTLIHVPFTVQQKDVQNFICQEIARVSL